MPIHVLKEQEQLDTPLVLFECELPTGAIERWSTHRVTVDGKTYEARVLRHNAFELKSGSEDGVDSLSRLSLTLSNVDSRFSQIERNGGWKGARLKARFAFVDLVEEVPVSETVTLFVGIANPPEEINETSIRLSFTNRLSLQRLLLPEVRIQRRCPWMFPATAEQRQVAVDGGPDGKYSFFYRCGYSPDVTGGVGNLDTNGPFTSCDYSREQCEQRGMFRRDSAGRPTARFGGLEFVPSDILVRSYGEKGTHLSRTVENQARYNDFVPIIYGTAWYEPPIVFARNDGNLTRMEVLLGAGEIEGVLKVVVNDIEIPEGVAGVNMTGTGWFNIVSKGGRNGGFNLDFADSAGNPLGDPYGSMAFLSLVVPNRISDGKSLPRVKVLLQGLKLPRFDENGNYLGESFTNNPAWVLLDVFRRSGWRFDEIDVKSFAKTAAFCAEQIEARDNNGNLVMIPRFQCNLVLTKRRSAADIVRGIRVGSSLQLTFSGEGKLQLRPETTLRLQQPEKPEGSNSTEPLDGGWPAYEFGDSSSPFSGILRRGSGEPALRVWSRSTADTPNRFHVEFQDEFNEYQQDSLSIVNVDDAVVANQEISAPLNALGIPNFSQASRIIRTQLDRSVRGNVYVEFDTSVRAIGLQPGDIITITYLKEGFNRQPFRIRRIIPGPNYMTATIVAQIHEDLWYETDSGLERPGRRQREYEVRIPRPLVGLIARSDGETDYEVVEQGAEGADGAMILRLKVGFIAPTKPTAALRGLPILGFSPDIETVGGSLPGGQTYYYAVSAVDGQGEETGISFVARARIPAGSDTNRVTLNSLSFPSGAAGFHVYRGSSPAQLLRIASNQPISATFVDDGLEAEAIRPPDANYDHANFYWRLETRPETDAEIFSRNTIGNSSLQMVPDEHKGMTVRITAGRGAGQEAIVLSNDETTLTLSSNWVVEPDGTSKFCVAESAWHFAVQTTASPVEFEVPNRGGATIHIVGRSANVFGDECSLELSPVTRWRIGGASVDADKPDAPVFGLSVVGRGNAELLAIGFPSLENTRSITAGTFSVGYWDELKSPNPYELAAPMDEETEYVELNAPGPGQAGHWLQVGREIMVISEVLDDGQRYRVVRASHESPLSSHDAGEKVYHLDRKVFVLPFVRDFFGSPASGNYSFPFYLPNARIALGELFVTNSRGHSETSRFSFTSLVDGGLRTLSGGQMSMQVEGYLAVQSNAVPTLIVDATQSVRDIFATVREAPALEPVVLELRQDSETYAVLTIPPGATISNVVDGFGLPPLRAGASLDLDIVAAPQGGAGNPGRDLTVTIRL